MAERICSISDCDRPHIARGWCTKHYQRWKTHGDPLAGQTYGSPRRPCKVSDCDLPGTQGGGLGFCYKHYRRHYRHGSPLITSRIVGDDVARFECYIKTGPVPDHDPRLAACWLWTGALTKDGYGVMEVQDLPTASAHRWSYRYHVGPLLDGLELDHLCRVRSCVNPWHLDQVPHRVNIDRANALRTA